MSEAVVLLPTYNEAGNLPILLSRLSHTSSHDVLVIDDASPDKTGELAESLRATYPFLSVLHRRKRCGLGPAYISGFKEALGRGYRRIVTMDADLSHDPEAVPALLRALSYCDVVIGSRWAGGGGSTLASAPQITL